jgi:hypothetical protein
MLPLASVDKSMQLGLRRTKEMSQIRSRPSSLPDDLISWATASGLIAFGVIFIDDAVIMGKTIFALGIIAATSRVLKRAEARSQPPDRYRRARLTLAIAYIALLLVGFLFPPGR